MWPTATDGKQNGTISFNSKGRKCFHCLFCILQEHILHMVSTPGLCGHTVSEGPYTSNCLSLKQQRALVFLVNYDLTQWKTVVVGSIHLPVYLSAVGNVSEPRQHAFTLPLLTLSGSAAPTTHFSPGESHISYTSLLPKFFSVNLQCESVAIWQKRQRAPPL